MCWSSHKVQQPPLSSDGGRYQKKTTPSKLKVKSSSFHLKNIYICFSKESMGFSLTDICDLILLDYQCAGFWLMPAGIFLGHGQKWHKDSSPRRQCGNIPLLWRMKERSIPMPLFFAGFVPSPFFASTGVVCTQISFCTSLYPTLFNRDNIRRSNFLLGWAGEETIFYSCHQPFLEQKCSRIMLEASSWVK